MKYRCIGDQYSLFMLIGYMIEVLPPLGINMHPPQKK